MKTAGFSTPHETRARLLELVKSGYVLHGSPFRDLDLLRPAQTGFQHIDKSGRDVPKEELLCATDDLDYAIFFAAAHAPTRNERIARNIRRGILGSSVTGIFDSNDQFLGYQYYAGDPTKDFIQARETSGVLSAVYYYRKDGLKYRESDRDWVTATEVRAVGSLTVSVACLSFDYYDLPDPVSNPMIAEYNRRADAQ